MRTFGHLEKLKIAWILSLTTVCPTSTQKPEKMNIYIRVWRSWERGWFGTIRPQVRSLSLGPLRVFISSKINTRITLLLISFLVLNFESLDSAEVFSLCFSLLELVISIIGLTGGVDMVSISIVVGLGCYGGYQTIEPR